MTPTIQRRRLGLALKYARENAGKTQEEAGAIIDSAAGKISRIELGQSGIKPIDLAILLTHYGITGAEAQAYRELSRAGSQRGRWSGHRGAIPGWFRQYVDLELDATAIHWYQTEIVPGIFQTEPYIRTMMEGGNSAESHVRVRLDRQTVTDQTDKKFNMIVSESALRRLVGGDDVMCGQLDRLAQSARQPNVTLQVLPFSSQTFGDSWIPFTILRFDNDPNSDVIYLEDYTDATYLDRTDDVRAYSRLWSRLSAAAFGPDESHNLIVSISENRKVPT